MANNVDLGAPTSSWPFFWNNESHNWGTRQTVGREADVAGRPIPLAVTEACTLKVVQRFRLHLANARLEMAKGEKLENQLPA